MMVKRGLVISGFLVCFILSMFSVSAINEGSEFVPDISDGMTRTFYIGDVLGFNIFGGRHTFLLSWINDDSVNIKLSAPVITATMATGEERRFDFNGDEIYDVYVKIHSIMPAGHIKVANVTVQTIAEPVGSVHEPIASEPETIEEPEENASDIEDVVIEEGADEDKLEPESDDGWKIALWVAGGIIIIAAFAFYLVSKKK